MTAEPPKTPRGWSIRSRAIWLTVVLLVVAYGVLRPSLERRLGVSLPTIPLGADTDLADHPGDSQDAHAPPTRELPDSTVRPAPPRAAPPVLRESSPKVGKATDRLGQLTDLGGGVQRSTAGLRYTPGSDEGHRLKHVLRHDNDLPDRPGIHGVFDGDADTLLAVIDEAYRLVQQGSPRVKTERQGDRLVHDVDLGRRIGFVGGQVGQRRGHPPATHVRLILEGDRVISAFPF